MGVFLSCSKQDGEKTRSRIVFAVGKTRNASFFERMKKKTFLFAYFTFEKILGKI